MILWKAQACLRDRCPPHVRGRLRGQRRPRSTISTATGLTGYHAELAHMETLQSPAATELCLASFFAAWENGLIYYPINRQRGEGERRSTASVTL